MQMIRPDWTRLKLIILFSVLLTVLKLRFSRVRKYFWFRDMVDIWPEILMTDSSRDVVCSGEVPFLEGRSTRASFSTYNCDGQYKVWLEVVCSSPGVTRTAISKSTNLSVTVLISLLKQNE